jgi:hypothetical protein
LARRRKKSNCCFGAWTKMSVIEGAILYPFFKILSALALGLSISGCVTAGPPYPNVVPIDTTGNFGAR